MQTHVCVCRFVDGDYTVRCLVIPKHLRNDGKEWDPPIVPEILPYSTLVCSGDGHLWLGGREKKNAGTEAGAILEP